MAKASGGSRRTLSPKAQAASYKRGLKTLGRKFKEAKSLGLTRRQAQSAALSTGAGGGGG